MSVHRPTRSRLADGAPARSPRTTRRRRSAALLRACHRDAGMATAEYAIATLAAVGFAGLLVVILRSDAVRALLLGIITRALSS